MMDRHVIRITYPNIDNPSYVQKVNKGYYRTVKSEQEATVFQTSISSGLSIASMKKRDHYKDASFQKISVKIILDE